MSALSKNALTKLKEAQYCDERNIEVKINKYTLRKLLEKAGENEADTDFLLDNLYKIDDFVNSENNKKR